MEYYYIYSIMHELNIISFYFICVKAHMKGNNEAFYLLGLSCKYVKSSNQALFSNFKCKAFKRIL